MIRILSLTTILVFATTALAKDETRKVAPFDGVDIRVPCDAKVIVGKVAPIELDGEEKILDILETTIDKEGTLIVALKKGENWPGGELKVVIHTDKLNRAALKGAGDLEVTGVKAETFAATLEGSGELEIDGEAKTIAVTLGGSGDIDADELTSASAVVTLSGSGDIDVTASENLVATINGSGTIKYRGDCKVQTIVNGTGTVEKS